MGDAGYVELLIEYWHMAIVAALLLLISIGFLFKFVVPARRLSRELSAAIDALGGIRPGSMATSSSWARSSPRRWPAHLWPTC